MFASPIHFKPSLIFEDKARSPPLDWGLIRASALVGQSLNLNVRLGWKLMALTNTLAYFNAETITAAKSCIVHAPVAIFSELFSL